MSIWEYNAGFCINVFSWSSEAWESYRILEDDRPVEQAVFGVCWGWRSHLLWEQKGRERGMGGALNKIRMENQTVIFTWQWDVNQNMKLIFFLQKSTSDSTPYIQSTNLCHFRKGLQISRHAFQNWVMYPVRTTTAETYNPPPTLHSRLASFIPNRSTFVFGLSKLVEGNGREAWGCNMWQDLYYVLNTWL